MHINKKICVCIEILHKICHKQYHIVSVMQQNLLLMLSKFELWEFFQKITFIFLMNFVE